MRNIFLLLAFLCLSFAANAQLIQKPTYFYVKAGLNVDIFSPASNISGALTYDEEGSNADFQDISYNQLSITLPLMKYVVVGFSSNLGLSSAFGYGEIDVNDTISYFGGDGDWTSKGISLSTGIEYHPMGVYARRFNPYMIFDFRYTSLKASYSPHFYNYEGGYNPSSVVDIDQSVSVLSFGLGMGVRLAERTFFFVEFRQGTAGEGIKLSGVARNYSGGERSFNYSLDNYYNFQVGLIRKFGRN